MDHLHSLADPKQTGFGRG